MHMPTTRGLTFHLPSQLGLPMALFAWPLLDQGAAPVVLCELQLAACKLFICHLSARQRLLDQL